MYCVVELNGRTLPAGHFDLMSWWEPAVSFVSVKFRIKTLCWGESPVGRLISGAFNRLCLKGLAPVVGHVWWVVNIVIWFSVGQCENTPSSNLFHTQAPHFFQRSPLSIADQFFAWQVWPYQGLKRPQMLCENIFVRRFGIRNNRVC